MSSRKGKETDKKPTGPSSSTHTRRLCSTKGSNGKQCPGDGKYDSSNGNICRNCYYKTHRQATVGNIASSSRTQESSYVRSSPSVSPQSYTAQKHSRRRTDTGTQSHNVGAPSNKGKRRASRTPSSGRQSSEYHPVSPDLTGIGTSEGLDSSPSHQIPAYGQGDYHVEYELYQPPQPPFQSLGDGQREELAENQSCRRPKSPWYPCSPDLTGFTIPEAELAPRAYATSVVEQSPMQSLDTQQTQYLNRDYGEGDFYSVDTPPREIRQTPFLTSAPEQRAGVDSSRTPAARPGHTSWESGLPNEYRTYVSSYSRTTTAGGEGSSGFNQMPNVSEIQSQMRWTRIENPNVLATSDFRGSYDQMQSTSYTSSSAGAGPSSSRLPETSLGTIGNEQLQQEKQQWELNKHEMRRQYLERYPEGNPVSERPEEFRAHLLFAMSLGEGRRCTFRGSGRCSEEAVVDKRFFLL